jgi:hypothetical protein
MRLLLGVGQIQDNNERWTFDVRRSSLKTTLNVEPLAQTWIRLECLYSIGHGGLRLPKKNSKLSRQGRPEPLNLGRSNKPLCTAKNV